MPCQTLTMESFKASLAKCFVSVGLAPDVKGEFVKYTNHRRGTLAVTKEEERVNCKIVRPDFLQNVASRDAYLEDGSTDRRIVETTTTSITFGMMGDAFEALLEIPLVRVQVALRNPS